jgi:hypothetical protein
MDQSGGGEVMSKALVRYDCGLKEAWKAFIEHMQTEDFDKDLVFVYDKTEEVNWIVEESYLDDFAEELWHDHSLSEMMAYTDDPFEDYVIIKLVHFTERDKDQFPLSFNKGKRTAITDVYRFTHHFTIDFSPRFGSTV